MQMTTLPVQSDDFAQRIATIRRHLHGLAVALDALERDYAKRYNDGVARPAGEVATQRAREAARQTGPLEVKVIQ